VKNLIVLLSAILLTSCYYNKKLVYLKDKSFTEQQPKLVENKKSQYRIQSNDVLSVKVKGTTDAQVSDIFNIAPGQGSMFVAPANLYLEGYSVNQAGQITLPVLGVLTVKGMTVEEVQEAIQNNARKYLNNATVIVKIISFKIAVIGEVKNPGYYYVYNNQANLLEGLALAGDLTPIGNRRNIKLLRQVGNGTQVVVFNLSNASVLRSEYFYLMPNDVLYVEPLRANAKRSNLEVLGVAFSAITTTVLLLSYIDSRN